VTRVGGDEFIGITDQVPCRQARNYWPRK
jgi:hypothetical protein